VKRNPALGICAAVALVCITSAGSAQTPPSDGYDRTYEELIGPQKLPTLFDPEKYGMQKIDRPEDLFSLLTRKGRCQPGKTVKSGVPCAYVSYASPGTREDAYRESLRPIFKVESEDHIWTFLNSRLSLARIDDLLNVEDLADASGPERRTSYRPTALVGYDENQANCARSDGKSCVDAAHFLVFNRKKLLTPGCMDEIWNKRGGATGSGHQSRCRFDVPAR
jgi:hypothetical protein